MARALRIEYPGALHHVTSRGNGRQKTFLNEADFMQFLLILKDVSERFNWVVYSYCLMSNHYHLLIETPEANLAKGMRQLNGVYTQKFNYFHKRVGHLFQGRYKSILVEKENYLGELIRYIILNPVRAGIVKRPEQWKWSSHKDIIVRKEKKDDLVKKKNVIDIFGGKTKYLNFINERIEDIDFWGELRGNIILGSQEFLDNIQIYIGKQKDNKEIVKKSRQLSRPKLEKIICADNRSERNKMIAEAYYEYGYSQKEISEYLAMHYASISRIIKQTKRLKYKTQDLTPFSPRLKT
jgi:putative transposase